MNAELNNRFKYHAPDDKVIATVHERVRSHCADLAAAIESLVPETRERSLAFANLEQVMFWANASIARHHRATLDHIARKDAAQADPESWPE